MTETATPSLKDVHPRQLGELVDGIPTLPEVYQQLFARMEDPDVTVAQIAEIIARDPALSTKILHLVNSAFYGLSGQIETISRAVVVLGFQAVRSAALALGVFEFFKDEDSSSGLNMTDFWTHSIGVASVAKVLAEQMKTTPPEEAFVVGLLHDVGKLVEKRFFPGDFDAIAAKCAADDVSWLAAESELYGIDHAGIARALFRAWKFPTALVLAIGHHHKPRAADRAAQLATLVHLSDYAAYEMELGGPPQRPAGLPDPELLGLLNIELPVSTEVETEIRAEAKRSLAILDLLD